MASGAAGLIQQIQIDDGGKHNFASTAYGICNTEANNANKVVEMTGFTLIEGTTVHIKFTHNNTVANPTLNINGTGAKPIVQYGTTAAGTSDSTSGWYAGAILALTYDGTDWIRDQGFNTNNTYTITSVWCNTKATTAAKTFSNASYYAANDKSYFEITFRYANSAESALTLNGKTLYINGEPSSTDNHTIPAGKYLVYYDNNIYYIRTDGKITGDITGDAATVNGHTVEKNVPSNAVFTDTNKYHKSGSWSGLTYTATAVNGADELKFTIPDNYGDTKNPYASKTKNYVLAAPSNANGVPSFRALAAADIPNSILKWQTTTAESTALYDFGVYVNMNNANGSSMNGGNYFNILNMPYRKASGNIKADWGWQLGNTTSNDGRLWYRTAGDNVWGEWQTIAHATQSTSDAGSSSQPVYMTKTGVITPITAVGAAYGGTGKTTLKDSANALINALDTGSSDLTSNDYVITQYVGGGTTTTTYHRRPANKVVNATLVKAALGTVGTTAKKFLKDTGAWAQVAFSDLSGTATNAQLANSKVTIAGNDVSLGGSLTAATLTSSLGLSNALHFIGITSTTLTDGSTTATLTAKSTDSLSKTTGFVDGDVVMDGDQLREYVWSGNAWRLLGITTSTKYEKTTSGNTFISKVTQATDGTITAESRELNTSGTWSGNAATASSAAKLTTARNLGVALGSTAAVTFDGSANQTSIPVSGTLGIVHGGTGQTTLTAARQQFTGPEFIIGTWTAASGTWTGTTTDSELYDGKQIILYMPFAGSGNATLNLTLADGTTTGAKNVYFESTTRFTTHKGQNAQLHLIYHKALKLSNGTTYEGWWYVANRDTDNDYRTRQNVLADTDASNRSLLLSNPVVGTANNNTSYVTYRNDKIYANVNTGIITATGFNGNLTGNVTGNVSGSSGSCTGNAATATTATNLANNPSIQASTSNANQVTITAGGKTSSAYTVPYATSAGNATTATYIKCTDTRSATLNPTDLTAAQGVRFDFKAKGTINLTATDAYAGVMSFRPYASNSDWSGGNAHQLAFNSEGLHWRTGGASWGEWNQILDSDNTAAGANATASLNWSSTYTLATINGTDIKITTMAKPSYAFTDLTEHPTTLSGYGITDAKIASGVITLGSNTIIPITSIAELTGSTITATDLRTNLGLSAALRFIGKVTTDISESTTTAPTVTGVTNYVPGVGDVVLDKNNDAEYVCIAKSGSTYTWELLGRSGSWATSTHTHGNITNGGLLGAANMAVVTDGSKKITTADLSVSDPTAATTTSTTFIDTISQNAQGKITATKKTLPILTNVTQSSNSEDKEFPIILKNTNNTANETAGVKYTGEITINPHQSTITAPKFIGDSFTSSKMIILPDNGYASADGTTVGAIKITLPVTWTATMMSMKVDIYNYNNDNCTTYTIGGYNYTGSGGYWTNCSSSSIGYGNKTNLKVRFGHDGTKCCIIIGEIDTSWYYPKVQVRNVLLGHSGISLDKWMSGWTVSWITTLPENIDVIKSSPGIIPISHGGTNANNVATARSNLGTWSLVSDSYSTFMPADGTTNGWYKFNTAADNGTHGILPSNSGGAGNGHSYIGTSSWYWKYAYIDEIYGHLNGNADTATAIQTAGTTAQFYRGDNSWSNIIKQTANAALGVDTNLKIGTARKDLNFDIGNGSGTGINDGYAGGITWGNGTAAYAGIYYQSSGSYGTRLILATTNLYADGAKARMIIQNNGYVGIGTLSPGALLDVNGTIKIGILDGGQHIINGNVQLNAQSGNHNEGLRINRCKTGYANIYLGGTRNSASGNQTGGWWIGTLSTPADATSDGDAITNTVFTISNNNTADTFSIKGTRGATIGTNSGWAIRPRLAVGTTYQTGYNFYVNGTSYFNGTISQNGGDYYLINAGQQYARLYIQAIGQTDSIGQSVLELGNSIGSGTANNAYGTLHLYNTDTTSARYTATGWTGSGISNFTILGATSTAQNTTAWSTLILGNDKSVTTTDPHSQGLIRIYSKGTVYTDIQSQIATSGSHTVYLPKYGNDMYLTHVGSNEDVGSGKQPVYVAENGRITACNVTVGDAYTPVYSNAGVLTATAPVQYNEFTIVSADTQVDLNNDAYTADTYVLTIVITSGEANINAPINWTSSTGKVRLSTTVAVSGDVSGYILTARGTSLVN